MTPTITLTPSIRPDHDGILYGYVVNHETFVVEGIDFTNAKHAMNQARKATREALDNFNAMFDETRTIH